jgi:hypothetical protein
MNGAAALVALVAMSGCVTTGLVPTLVWSKDGDVDQAQLRHDEYECHRDAVLFFSNVAGHGPITASAAKQDAIKLYRRCMESRGYREVKD